jgi:hypothetical protein
LAGAVPPEPPCQPFSVIDFFVIGFSALSTWADFEQ